MLVLLWASCAPETADPGSAPTSPPRVTADPPPSAPGLARAAGQRFEDVTVAWGITHEKARGNGVLDQMAASVCAIDVDGAPPLDLLFVRRGIDDGGPVLYVGEGTGRYADETVARGLGDVEQALGCLAFDRDGDGDQDILLLGAGLVAFFDNVDGSFERHAGGVEASYGERYMFISAAAGDFDGDADLDVIVGGYVDFDPDVPPSDACRAPCAFESGFYPDVPNLLLVYDRAADVYRDQVAARTGGATGLANPWPTLAVGAVDVDLDGVLEIFVGNDFRNRDQLWWRGPATEVFFDLAPRFGIGRSYRGFSHDTMGWSSGDVDGDGLEDHVITGFEGDATSIHVSRGDQVFEDEARTVGMLTRQATFRWGPALVDLDLDGDLDLVEATGHVYREEHFDAVGADGPEAQPTNLFDNEDGVFVPVETVPSDGLSTATNARGIAVADLDDDGRPDIVLAGFGPPQVLRNVTQPRGHWIRVRLVDRAPNTAAVGARIEVTAPGNEKVLVRHVKAGEGYGGSFDPRVHFGVGALEEVDVHVRWPDGTRTERRGVGVDAEIEMRHGP